MCETCGQFNQKVNRKTGEIKEIPVVKIPKNGVRLTESSTCPVPGHSLGENIKYLWIGEAPGEEEDANGRPFIGRSGKYLKRRLIAQLAGLNLSECRFTNVVKCHPIGNRDPYASELKACWHWLEQEIQLIDPSVIFLVGRIATKMFLPDVSIKQGHGQVFEWNDYPVMPLYHPAAVNRAVSKKVLEADYSGIQDKLNSSTLSGEVKTVKEKPSYTLVSDIARLDILIQNLETTDEFALDIETNESEYARSRGTKAKPSPDPLTNELVGIAIAFEDEGKVSSWYIPLADYTDTQQGYRAFGVKSWDSARQLVLNLLQPLVRERLVYIHNAKFEINSLAKYEFSFNKVWCTYLAAYTLREETLGLKDIVKRRFSVSMKSIDEIIDVKKQVMTDAPLRVVFPYGCADAEYCYKYAHMAMVELEKNNQIELYDNTVLPLMYWAAEQELQGLEIDLDKMDELKPFFADRLDELKDNASDSVGVELDDTFFNSPQQKSDFLFDDLGLPETRLTPSGKHYSTQKEDLEAIKGEHAIVPILIEIGSLSTIKSTFIDGIPKRIHPETRRLHANVNQGVAETMRLSYSGPNWQNLPVRTKESKRIREIVVPDEVGWWIIAIDQSQIELRWAAHLSQDSRMIEILSDVSRNFHEESCMFVYEITKDDDNWDYLYKNTKNGNFADIYGAGIYKMAETLECSLEDAKRFMARKRELFPEFFEWKQEQKKHVRKLGYVETHFGFRRYVPEIQASNKVLRSRGERLAVNVPVQGCLPASTRILTRQGWKPIGEFEAGDVWDGESWSGAERLNMGQDKRVRLTLSDGRSFDCDTRHKLLVHDEVWPRWESIDNIIGKPLVRDNTGIQWGIEDREIEDWYWVGRFIGDGWLQDKGARWKVAFGSTELKDKDKLLSWLSSKNIGGETNSTVGFSEYADHNGNPEVRGGTKKGKAFWVSFGIKPVYAHLKRIPPIVFTLDYDRRLAFFNGYFDADGYERESSSKLTSTSYGLLEDTLRLMQTLGMTGSIGQKQIGKNYYDFFDLYIHKSPRTLEVTDVEYTGKQETMYTLSVNSPRHAFSSEGLISKNSSAGHIQSAMVPIRKELRRRQMGSRMIIQVHDELVFSVPDEEVEKTVSIARKHLEGVVSLSVPTPVDVEIGENWGELMQYDEWQKEYA